jgi:hypothetical protein
MWIIGAVESRIVGSAGCSWSLIALTIADDWS